MYLLIYLCLYLNHTIRPIGRENENIKNMHEIKTNRPIRMYKFRAKPSVGKCFFRGVVTPVVG